MTMDRPVEYLIGEHEPQTPHISLFASFGPSVRAQSLCGFQLCLALRSLRSLGHGPYEQQCMHPLMVGSDMDSAGNVPYRINALLLAIWKGPAKPVHQRYRHREATQHGNTRAREVGPIRTSC